MRRRTITVGAVVVTVATAALLAVAPTPDYAAALWKYIAYAVAFAAFTIGLPAYLSFKANGRPVPWRAIGRFMAREAPIEAAVVLTIASAVLIAGSGLQGGLPGLAALALAIAIMGAVAAATVENLWGYMAYGEEPEVRWGS